MHGAGTVPGAAVSRQLLGWWFFAVVFNFTELELFGLKSLLYVCLMLNYLKNFSQNCPALPRIPVFSAYMYSCKLERRLEVWQHPHEKSFQIRPSYKILNLSTSNGPYGASFPKNSLSLSIFF